MVVMKSVVLNRESGGMLMKKKQQQYFRITEMMPGVYGFSNCMVASFLIVGKEKALLFDTGYGVADIKAAVEEITTLPLYVVNSRGHVDHTSGNFHFPGPYYMHKADLEVYHRHNAPDFRTIAIRSLQKIQKILFWVKWLPKELDLDTYYHTKAKDDFIFIEEGYTFDLGGITAEVVELPGHTPGSIGLLVKEKGIFFASDGINANVWLFLPESQKLSVYLQSLKKAQALEFDYLVTGHSVKLEPKSNLENYIAVAANPDIENAKAADSTDFAPDVEAIRCMDMANRNKKRKDRNPAAIVISRDKL